MRLIATADQAEARAREAYRELGVGQRYEVMETFARMAADADPVTSAIGHLTNAAVARLYEAAVQAGEVEGIEP
jgi:hypothetical protein